MRIWSSIQRFGPSAALYLGGVGAFYVADLLIGSYGERRTIAEWALLRSYMNGMGTLSLFGLHALLFREPEAASLILRVGLVQITASALIGGVVATYAGWVPSFFTAVVPVLGFSANAMVFQWLRSRHRLTAAYLVAGSWRLAFLIGVVGLVLTGILSAAMVLCLAFAASTVIMLKLPSWTAGGRASVVRNGEVTSIFDVYRVGGSLLLANLSLAVSSYGEVIVINYLGTSEDVATYFRASVFFLLPGVVVSQYVVALVEPILRDSEDAAQSYLRRYMLPALVGLVFVVWPGLFLGGWVVERLFTGHNEIPVSLALLLSLTTCVRLAYILPSSYVGILADRRQLARASFAYFIFAILMPLIALVLMRVGLGPVMSVAVANLVNWVSRTQVGAAVIQDRIQIRVAQ